VGSVQPMPAETRNAAPIINAEPGASDVPDVGGAIMLGAIRVEGNAAIPSSAFAPVIESWIGQQADTQKLQMLARSIADLARARGYIFASAMIPAQSVETGIVTVRLNEGRVDQVRVTGSSNPRLPAILNKIVGEAVQKSAVERNLLLAEDVPGITILSARYVREGTQAVLQVDVRQDHHSGSVSLDNSGPKTIGPVRLSIRYELAGLIDHDDVLTVQGVMTPLQPKELAFGSLRYARSIGSGGTQIGVAGAFGATRPEITGAVLAGKSRYGALFVSQPLLRSAKTSLWWYNEIAYLSVDQSVNGLPAQSDAIATFSTSLSGLTRFAGGRLSGGVGLVQGLNILGTTRNGDLLASRRDASGSFTKGQMWLNWTGSLIDRLTLRLAASGQIASKPLLAAQELGLGGAGFGRGYDFNERFGDNGILGLAELRQQFDRPMTSVDWMQLYGFVDGGVVSNRSNGLGGGSLLSGGGGIRAALGKVELGVEAALPINEPRRESGSKRIRLNMSLGVNFRR
jgi:hemolysin activation/secretion protein